MSESPAIIAMDLEGVLVPEIWIGVAERTGITELRRTTRDEPDYDKLMRFRLDLLDHHGIGLQTIQDVIADLDPMPGAREYLDWVRSRTQAIILSDTYYQFAAPLMAKLGHPVLFCHTLDIASDGRITGYRLRLKDQKRASTEALRQLKFRVLAVGDSYNDTNMLLAAHHGILFRPSAAVMQDFPQFPVVQTHAELRCRVEAFLAEG